jgi:hypothetical protein
MVQVPETLKNFIRKPLKLLGYQILKIKHQSEVWFPNELAHEEKKIVSYVLENRLTMASFERVVSTALAVRYVIQNQIEGDFVECGVWRGGNSIIAAKLVKLHESKKKIWLYDTFTGMTEPNGQETDMYGANALHKFKTLPKDSTESQFWCISSIEEVKNAFSSLDLLSDNVHFVQGDVSKTLEDEPKLPKKISVLRLDTDWYESTLKELEILYPRLEKNGILIIDDYGHWSGSRAAVEEYFSKLPNKPFLHPIDNTGRLAIKT